MATRGNTLSIEHIQALNLIDLDFYMVDLVRDAWNIYRDHLNSYPNGQSDETQKRWEENRTRYFTDLLYAISSILGYKFDKVILKKGASFPVAHGILNMEQALIRQGFIEIISGKKSLKVSLEKPPE